ncbi:MAG: acetyl-CoA carboxylase, biotin carboxyl carrier protein [Ponticaulis sp.]|nr:acetyl-CoA carboxylase, biotin carboxyl carrier protein [Ponticaulis sp.]|tara:strand:+ start:27927 stop:28418 length:492 start_codon:yes stop_codon:yes gene_type:complete
MANDKHTVDPALVRELAAILREADLGEIEVEQGELKIRVSKPAAPAPAAISYAAPPAPAPAAASAPAPAAAPAAESAPSALAADEHIVTSPMIGTFYSSPSPDADPFVEKGTDVTNSSVICIIEAMKVMNEIKSDVSGKIIEILVQDAEAVEFGQPLFKVKRA